MRRNASTVAYTYAVLDAAVRREFALQNAPPLAEDLPTRTATPTEGLLEPGSISACAARKSRNGPSPPLSAACRIPGIPKVVLLVVILRSEHQANRSEEKLSISLQIKGGR